jgi:hypothetical protein
VTWPLIVFLLGMRRPSPEDLCCSSQGVSIEAIGKVNSVTVRWGMLSHVFVAAARPPIERD